MAEPPERSKLWAVVPVAGSGKRLRPHTHTHPKALLQVAGQPIMGHIVDQLVPLGIQRIVLVVGHMGERVVDYVRGRRCFESVVSVQQVEALGLGHAILLTRDVVGDDPMLIVYGDTVFRADLEPVLASSADGMLGVQAVEDPSRFGVVVEVDGRVQQLLEKPEIHVSDRAIVGVNLVNTSSLLFQCLDELMANDLRSRGEFQLTDALQGMVDQGRRTGYVCHIPVVRLRHSGGPAGNEPAAPRGCARAGLRPRHRRRAARSHRPIGDREPIGDRALRFRGSRCPDQQGHPSELHYRR